MKGNYKNSKIYKIEPIADHDEGEVYFGSTTQKYLSDRMRLYKEIDNYPHIRVFDLFDKYGVNNCQILLVETFPCESKDKLHAREGYYQKNNKCVNKNISGRSKSQYQIDNKENLDEKKKEYEASHKEEYKKMYKDYRQANIEKIKAYDKKRYQDDPNRKLYNCEQIKCHECDCFVMRDNMYRHKRTEKHLINSQH